MPENCQHEGETTELANFVVNQHTRNNRRYYEIYVCHDCGKLINMHKLGADITMMPSDIEMLFADIHDMISDAIDEIEAQAKSMQELLSGINAKMVRR